MHKDVEGNGGDEGTRTPDPRDANAVLFQLSYIPTGADEAAEVYRRVPAGSVLRPGNFHRRTRARGTKWSLC